MAVLEVVLPIVLVVLLGYGIVWQGVLGARDVEGISRFVFKVGLPVLLFNSLSDMQMPALFHWQFLFSYYFVSLLIYAIGYGISRYWFAHSLSKQGIFGFGSSYSNLVLVGLPIISTGLGQEAVLPLFMLVSLQSAIFFPIVILLVERESHAGQSWQRVMGQTMRNVVSNPIILGLCAGILVNFLAIPIPLLLAKALGTIGQAALPCALFVLGASLRTYKLAGHLAEAWTMMGLKLLLQPILVGVLVFGLFQEDPLWGAVAVMAAGMPVGVNAFLFAQEYQVGVATVSTSVLLSTLLSVFSLSLMLFIFMPG